MGRLHPSASVAHPIANYAQMKLPRSLLFHAGRMHHVTNEARSASPNIFPPPIILVREKLSLAAFQARGCEKSRLEVLQLQFRSLFHELHVEQDWSRLIRQYLSG
jgi:hypothetical protein